VRVRRTGAGGGCLGGGAPAPTHALAALASNPDAPPPPPPGFEDRPLATRRENLYDPFEHVYGPFEAGDPMKRKLFARDFAPIDVRRAISAVHIRSV